MPIFSDLLIRTFASSNNLSQLFNDYVDKKIYLSVKSLSYEPNVKNYDIFFKGGRILWFGMQIILKWRILA
jgi:hypothetical protein